MPTDDKLILRIQNSIENLGDGQIGVETGNHPFTGHRMYGGVDGAGNAQRWLALDERARSESISLIGSTTTGTTGLLKHDTAGAVTGGQLTEAALNDLIVGDPIGGVLSLASTDGGTQRTGDLLLLAGQNVFIDDTDDGDGFVFSAIVEEVIYSADSVTLTTGTLIDGDVDSTHEPDDDDAYEVQEVSGVPGFDILFDFVAVDDFDKVTVRLKYDGAGSHVSDVQLYNYNTTTWDDIGSFTLSVSWQTIEMPIISALNYIDGGDSRVRLYHSQNGIASHDIHIDYLALVRNTGGGSALVRPEGEVVFGTGTSVTSDPYFIFDNTAKSIVLGNSGTASGTNALAIGASATASGNNSFARGVSATASAYHSFAEGPLCNAAHPNAAARGNGASSDWEGAEHFCSGRINGAHNSQCMSRMALAIETTDDTATTMRYDLTDAVSPLACPDGCMQYYEIIVSACSTGGTYSGIKIFKMRLLIMRIDPDLNSVSIDGAVSVLEDRGALPAGVTITKTEDDTNKAINIRVTGHATTDITWVAHISRGIQSECDYYDSGS